MQHDLVLELGHALSSARHDDTLAMQTLLDVTLAATGAVEARLLVLDGDAVETWRLDAGGSVTLAVALDGTDDGFTTWRASIALGGTHVVLASALPCAPGIDAGLIGIVVPQDDATVAAAAHTLDEIAVLAGTIISAARADLERRIAVDAARRGGRIVSARDTATQLQRRAQWAVSALDQVRAEGAEWSRDAASHVHVMHHLVEELLQDLQD